MGCPDAIVGSLAVMQDVTSINFNIENRVFILISDRFKKEDLIKVLAEVSIIEKRNFVLKSYSEENFYTTEAQRHRGGES